jgi:hypothetical protein
LKSHSNGDDRSVGLERNGVSQALKRHSWLMTEKMMETNLMAF